VGALVCPRTHEPLRWSGELRDGRLWRGVLSAGGGAPEWPVSKGWVRLYRDADLQGVDRWMRRIYDGLPRLHDPAVRFTIPLFETEGTEHALRSAYMRRLELETARPATGEPLRILEVGVGTGANLPLIRRAAPSSAPLEVWGLDPSIGMLRECARRLDRTPGLAGTRLLLGDGHRLPFRDGAFDRVFHVGGINAFHEPGRAIAEMARVARPGTPIVLVDEQLDPTRRHTLYHRLMFRLVTFYDDDPRAPVDALPAGATDVFTEQASRFFYTLRFRMPADEAGSAPA
jgi:SAM-dependent methyltransferase